jgi:hypothetical protein
MAKNIEHVFFLRNGSLYNNRADALAALEANKDKVGDGEFILARYENENNEIITITGIKHELGSASGLTFVDIEGIGDDIEKLRQEINAKLGTGITSANTATAQLETLSGNTFTPGTSNSADTSVEGAKAYAYDLVDTLDYTDAVVPGQVVVEVDEADGVIDVKRAALTSTGESLVLTNAADGSINFEANIDNATIVQGADKKLKVSDSALTQHYGDEKTIHMNFDTTANTKTFSTLIKIAKNAAPSDPNVKEEYNLVDADGNNILSGDTIKVYKDSSLYNVYLGHVDDTITSPTDPTVVPGSGDTALCFIYQKADGTYELVAINVEEFIEENEFASGVTWDSVAKVVKGVVDPASEKVHTEYDNAGAPIVSGDAAVLTVGADGFKVDNIQKAIDAAVKNGVKSAVNEIESSNDSISATSSITEDGSVKYDLVTDASLIKMSGFTADVSGFTGITEATSVSDAVKEVENEFLINEEITSAALNDLNDRVLDLSATTLTGVSVNGSNFVVFDRVAEFSIEAKATSTLGATTAIVVDTDAQGNIKLGLGVIDCGTYD